MISLNAQTEWQDSSGRGAEPGSASVGRRRAPGFDAQYLRERLSYNSNTGEFRWLISNSRRAPVGSVAGCVANFGYWRIGILGRHYAAHNLAWMHVTGEWPHRLVDHINGDKRDNRFCNLRLATFSQNVANRSAYRCHLKGAHPVKGKWRARITKNRQTINLGTYDSETEAHNAYQIAAADLFGEFARFK